MQHYATIMQWNDTQGDTRCVINNKLFKLKSAGGGGGGYQIQIANWAGGGGGCEEYSSEQ
jgi:hypothetical protein